MALVGTAVIDVVTATHTLAAGNGNRVVVAGYFVKDGTLDPTPTGVTYGGQDMTFINSGVRTGTDPLCIYLFYILEADLPADGSNSLDFSALDTGTVRERMWVACFDDLAQQAPTMSDSVPNSGNNNVVDITLNSNNDTAVFFNGHRDRELFDSTNLDAYLWLDINSGGNSIVGGYALTQPAGTYSANWRSTTSSPGRVLGAAFAQLEAATGKGPLINSGLINNGLINSGLT